MAIRGIVDWFSNDGRGYGFIIAQDGNKVYLHVTDILNREVFKILKRGDLMEFDTVPGKKNTLRAVNVKALPRDHRGAKANDRKPESDRKPERDLFLNPPI